MRMINKSGSVVRLEQFKLVLKPGEECELADGYCLRRRTVNGGFMPSIVECLAPQLAPHPDERELYLKYTTDDLDKLRKKRVANAEAYMSRGIPRGVAEMMAVKDEQMEEDLPPVIKPQEVQVGLSAAKWAEEAKLPSVPGQNPGRGRPRKQ